MNIRKLFTIILCVFTISINAQIGHLRKAAEVGDLYAQKYLGRLLLKGDNYTERNVPESYKWYSAAANQGDGESQYVVSTEKEFIQYLKKDGIARDEWLKRSAANGYLEAMKEYASRFDDLRESPDAREIYEAALEHCLQTPETYLEAQYARVYLGDCNLWTRYGFNVPKLWKTAYNFANEVKDIDNRRTKECARELIVMSASRLGEGAYWNDSYDTSISWMEEVRTIKPDDEKANYFIGLCLFKKGKYDQAEEKLLKTVHYVKQDIRSEGFYFLSKIYDDRNEKTKSYTHIDNAIKYSSNSKECLETKGNYLIRDGRISEAIDIWKTLCSNNDSYASNSNSSFAVAIRAYLDGNNVDILSQSESVSVKENKENNKTFVVIIANEEYKYETPVQFAINDGTQVSEYSKKFLNIPDTNIKLIKNASYNDIRYAVNWLKKISAAYGSECKVIFYYAGHGIPDDSNRSAYILPVDGYGNDVVTGYSLTELYKTLGELPSKSIIVFLDACFSGTTREGNMMALERGVAIKVKPSTPIGNTIVFSAAQNDETAHPFTTQKHGLFTYFLLKKIKETNGECSIAELKDYVSKEVSRKSIVENGKSQTPSISVSQTITPNWKSWKLK